MKALLTIILITIGSFCYGQIPQHNDIKIDTTGERDSFITYRYFKDSLYHDYMVEYKFDFHEALNDTGLHQHYVSICSVIEFHGNRQKTIFSNYKAIYSPYECEIDNPDLWRKRLYQFLNKK